MAAFPTATFPSGTTAVVQVDMSAPITADDLARAGGLGAKDDMGHALPVAVDATDFEEELMGLEGASDAKGKVHLQSTRA